MKKALYLLILLFSIEFVFSAKCTIPEQYLQCNQYTYMNTREYFYGYDGKYIGYHSLSNCYGATSIKVQNNGGIVFYCDTTPWGSVSDWLNRTTCGAGYPETCEFYVCSNSEGSQISCNDTGVSCYRIVVPFYQGCLTPQFIINSSLRRSSDYYFSFNLTNTDGWSYVNCSFYLKEQQTNAVKYANTFNSTTNTFTVPFNNIGGRGIYYAEVECSYRNAFNQTEIFAKETWLVDNAVQFKIADKNRVIGRITPNPEKLYVYTNLSAVIFKVVSQSDKSDYGKPVKYFLNTTIDTDSIGCSGNLNKSGELYPLSFGGVSGIYFVDYSTYPFFVCKNNTSFKANLSVYETETDVLIDRLEFNITYSNGSMIIDNINLVYNLNENKLEFWATVSNDYYKTPIDDGAELKCNFWLKSIRTEEEFYGGMSEYRTYSSPGLNLIQTDMRNTTFNSQATYNLSENFEYQINCSALNYSDVSDSGMVRVSYFRVKTFNCYAVEDTFNVQRIRLSYTGNNYTTDPAWVVCELIVDTDIPNNATPTFAVYLTQMLSKLGAGDYSVCLHPYLNQNIPAATSSCTSQKYSNRTTGVSIFQQGRFMLVNYLGQPIPLKPGKYTLLASFWGGYSANESILDWVFSKTAIDLSYITSFTNVSVQLRIINNKTKTGVIESGDILACETNFYDPEGSVVNVRHEIIDNSTQELMCTEKTTYPSGNIFKTYSSFINVNDDCPVFKIKDRNGSLTCRSTIILYNGEQDVEYSNSLPFFTPLSEIPPSQLQITFENFVKGLLFDNFLVKMFLDLLYTDPLRFLIVSVLGIIAAILIIPPIVKVLFEIILLIIVNTLFGKSGKKGEE